MDVRLDIIVLETKLSVDDSQRITFPISPLKVKVPVFEPEHTVASELNVPPTVTGSTVMVTSVEFSSKHTPD